MRSDDLLRTIADTFQWDYNELYALKYELDQLIYYYGQHYRHPRETAERTTPERFLLCADQIKQVSEILDQNPLWPDIVTPSPTPTVLVFNYNYADWAAELQRAGYAIERPLWQGFETDNPVQGLLQVLCSLLKGMLSADFNLLLSNEFKVASQTVKRLLSQYYGHSRFKALLFPYSITYFEYTGVNLFKALGKLTFVFEHGVPACCIPEYVDIPDYTIVWGEQIKKNHIKGGAAPDKLIVAGHPTYRSFAPAPLRFSLEDVLVCTWSLSGAPAGNAAFSQNRGHMLYYLNTIEAVLKKVGVQRVRLRPHPCESMEWYERFVDPDFYRRDTLSLQESLQTSTLAIGPASTVLIEAIYYGVSYLLYHPEEFDLVHDYYTLQPPFDGTDLRIPNATTAAQLEQYILEKRSVDPSCFSDYVSLPFQIEKIIEKIAAA